MSHKDEIKQIKTNESNKIEMEQNPENRIQVIANIVDASGDQVSRVIGDIVLHSEKSSEKELKESDDENENLQPMSINKGEYEINNRVKSYEFKDPFFGVKNYDVHCVNTRPKDQDKERFKKVIELLRLDHLDEIEKEEVYEIIKYGADRFYIKGEKLGATDVITHRIPTTDEMPVNSKQYRFPEVHKEEIRKQVAEFLDAGYIRQSESPYNTPIWVVPKKADSQGNKRWRVVLDFRQLNEKTIGDAYPLPNIVDILDQLGGARYFSVFDLASGFYQIKMHPEDCHKTAFTTPYGHYEYVRMPMGLKNAPPTFQRAMDMILIGLQGHDLFVYLDDIVIYAKTLEEHNEKCKKLIDRLRKSNLSLQPDKCEFLKPEVAYLGHVISEEGLKLDPKKVEAVGKFPKPINVKGIRQFLGLTGYYRRFIEGYAKLAKPLTNLLKIDTPFIWGDEQEESFQKLREKLCTEPVLIFPDFSKPFIVTTDASGYAIGGILSQGPIGADRPIAYASRTLNDAETRYDTYEKEALAIVYSVLHFRPYLYGKRFTLVTDHKPLVWFRSCKDGNARVLRWRLKLAEYEYEVVYKAGKTNVNADALSRNPVETNRADRDEEIYVMKPYNIEDWTPEEMEIYLSGGKDEFMGDKKEEYQEEEEDPEQLWRESLTEEQLREITEQPSEEFVCNLEEINESNQSQDEEIENQEDPGDKGKEENPQRKRKKRKLKDPPVRHGMVTRRQLKPQENKEKPKETSSEEEEKIPKKTKKSRKVKRRKEKVAEKPEDTSSEEEEKSEFKKKKTPGRKKKIPQIQESEDTASIEETEEEEDEKEEENKDNELDKDNLSDENRQTDVEIETIPRGNVIQSRDLFFTRKDTLSYFLNIKGDALDTGSRKLVNRGEMPYFPDLELGKASKVKKGNRYHIALSISDDSGEGPTLILEHIKESLKSLRQVAEEIEIQSVSLAKTDLVENVPWERIATEIRLNFIGSPTKVVICHGIVRYPSKQEREGIIQEMHGSAVGGHRGVTKTFNRIRQYYYWEKLKVDIQNYIQKCLPCQLKKCVRNKTKQLMVLTDTPGTAFDKVAMDIVGPLPKTKSENEYILTIQDQLTKFCLAIPLVNATSASIADALVKHFISIFGPPKSVLTDQGRNFLSGLIRRVAKRFRIKRIRTTAFHPQSNGSLERSHHALGEYLKQYADKEFEWDEWVHLAIFNYNTSVHEGTKHTPYELVFGRLARVPSSEPLGMEDDLPTYGGYLVKLITQLHEIRRIARENLIEAKLKSKNRHDKKLNVKSFKIGDYVFLQNGPKPKKLADQYTGPHEIVELMGNQNIKIKTKKNIQVVHANRLRLSHILPG